MNIYLRLPKYTAAYYRNRDQENVLTEFMPVRFSKFSTEFSMISHSLFKSKGLQGKEVRCYSQRSWNNLLHGKNTLGTKQITNRNSKKWISMPELFLLENIDGSQRKEIYDYICIEIPNEVYRNNKCIQIDSSFTIPFTNANMLAEYMQKEFFRAIIEWIKQDKEYCSLQKLPFSKTTSLEGFLAEYDIHNSEDNHERESIKRNMNRFIQINKVYGNNKYFK